MMFFKYISNIFFFKKGISISIYIYWNILKDIDKLKCKPVNNPIDPNHKLNNAEAIMYN